LFVLFLGGGGAAAAPNTLQSIRRAPQALVSESVGNQTPQKEVAPISVSLAGI
jgi:hypothetical protein